MKVARDVKGQGNQNGTEMAGMENGVLFPRLHVKETKTAGPRAPPRNKMALYEQFTVPSHRFVQSAPGANRPNPAALFNAPASCDGRYVYPPYYVSPNVYTPVSFPGQFLGQTLISNTSDTTADSDKSTKCGLAKSKEQSSGVTINNSRTPRSRLDQKPFSAFGKDIDEITLQTSGRLSTSSVTGNATMGGPCGPTSGQKGSNSITGCASKDLRTVTPQQDNLHQLECLVQRSSSMAIQNDGVESGDAETQLCRKSNLCAHGDVYCAEEAHCLQKCSNEGAEDDSRVDCDDNRQSKDSSTSDNMTDLKEVNCFPIRECQTPAGDLSGAREQSKTSSASAESRYLGENHPRDLLKVVDACQGQKATKKDPNIRDQCKSQLCNNHESATVASGPVGNGKGDLSDHNSNSSMLDSIHAFEITPRSIVAAIGQKEFWRVRRAILRQQKIFSTQVFELHRLVKVQKLIARSPSVLIEDGAFGRTPVCTSEEQCVPSINPEKLPETSVVHASQDSKNAINKVKQGNKEMYTHSSMPSHPSARGYAQHLACEPRDQLYAAPVSLASFVPGSPSAAWGYPAYPANPYVVGMASHPGGYTCYQQYPLHQLGGPNSVMGIPYPLDVNPVESPDVRGYGHQSHTSAECQAKGPGKFSKYPFQDGLYYSSMMAPVPAEPFAPWARASHSFSDTGRSVGNGSGEEMSAASLGSESGLKQSKQAKHLDVSSNVYCSQESVSRVSVGEDNRLVTQMEQHIRHSKYNNIEFHPPASFSERAQHDGSTDDDKFNAKNWALAADADAGITVEYEPGKIGESQENSPDLRIAGDIENQALSLFPMPSSVSCASLIIKDESAFLSNEQRVRVIKAVPRAAMAAPESTADILLSLQRERQQ